MAFATGAYAQNQQPQTPAPAAEQSTPAAPAQEQVAPEPAEVLEPVDIEALYTELSSEPIYGETAVELLAELEDKHYTRVIFDDQFSQQVFDHYLEALDGQKLYFLQSDVDQFAALRTTLDDTLRSGSIDPAFDIYNRYHPRLLERLVYAIDLVENHLEEFDFTRDEYIELDREEAPYAATTEEL